MLSLFQAPLSLHRMQASRLTRQCYIISALGLACTTCLGMTCPQSSGRVALLQHPCKLKLATLSCLRTAMSLLSTICTFFAAKQLSMQTTAALTCCCLLTKQLCCSVATSLSATLSCLTTAVLLLSKICTFLAATAVNADYSSPHLLLPSFVNSCR